MTRVMELSMNRLLVSCMMIFISPILMATTSYDVLVEYHQKMLVMRRQARSADRFISIACVVPICGSEGSLTCFLAKNSDMHLYSACGVLNSFMFNYLAAKRQAGPNLNKAIWSCVPVPDLDKKLCQELPFFQKPFTEHHKDVRRNSKQGRN